MAMRTVYIRKELEETFDSLPSKAEFLNTFLKRLKDKREAENEVKVIKGPDWGA